MKFILSALCLALLQIPSGMASTRCTPGRPNDPCAGPTKPVTFTLACHYANPSNPTGFKSCTVSSSFTKAVTTTGGEVVDTSTASDAPTLLVVCDGNWIYNDSANRDTSLLGTIIQGESGPTPMITLERGELHDGYHTGSSTLLLNIGNSSLQTQGSCQIWASP